MLSYTFLQDYLWIVVSVLGTAFIFLLFVHGVGAVLPFLCKDEYQHRLVFNAIDAKWRFPFVCLVLFACYAFFGFPGFQSEDRSNGSFIWIPLFLCIVSHAAASEALRRCIHAKWLLYLCRIVVMVSSIAIPFIVGLSGSALVTGKSPAYGFDITLALLYVVTSQVSGLLYLYGAVKDDELAHRIKLALTAYGPLFIFFIASVFYLFATRDGIEYDSAGNYSVVQLKYLNNLIDNPFALVFFICGVCLIAISVVIVIVNSIQVSFKIFAIGMTCIIFTFMLVTGLNDTACFPDFEDPTQSLSIANSSGSYGTMLTLAILSLFLPFVAWHLCTHWNRAGRK